MKKTFFLSIAIASILSSCGGEAKKDEGIKLVFDPEIGQPVKMAYEFTVTSVQKGDKMHFAISMSGSTEKNDKGISLNMVNDKITMDGNIGGKNVGYDAAFPDSVPDEIKTVTTSVFSLLGKKFKSVYDERMNKNSEVIIKADSSPSDSVENKMQFFLRFPDTAISVGYTWQRELMIKSGNKMLCTATYKVKDIKDGKAYISMVGKLSGDGETFGHVFSIDGNLTGDITVDLKTGWPLDTEINQDFTLDLNGEKIPMKYNIKHTVSF